MKKEIWGVNVIGRQGVNAENDFSIGSNDAGNDVIVKIKDTELTGEEFAVLKEIAEGGPTPGGSDAIKEQDLNAIGFIPTPNTYYQQKSLGPVDPEAHFEEGVIYFYDGSKYNTIDGSGSGGGMPDPTDAHDGDVIKVTVTPAEYEANPKVAVGDVITDLYAKIDVEPDFDALSYDDHRFEQSLGLPVADLIRGTMEHDGHTLYCSIVAINMAGMEQGFLMTWGEDPDQERPNDIIYYFKVSVETEMPYDGWNTDFPIADGYANIMYEPHDEHEQLPPITVTHVANQDAWCKYIGKQKPFAKVKDEIKESGWGKPYPAFTKADQVLTSAGESYMLMPTNKDIPLSGPGRFYFNTDLSIDQMDENLGMMVRDGMSGMKLQIFNTKDESDYTLFIGGKKDEHDEYVVRYITYSKDPGTGDDPTLIWVYATADYDFDAEGTTIHMTHGWNQEEINNCTWDGDSYTYVDAIHSDYSMVLSIYGSIFTIQEGLYYGDVKNAHLEWKAPIDSLDQLKLDPSEMDSWDGVRNNQNFVVYNSTDDKPHYMSMDDVKLEIGGATIINLGMLTPQSETIEFTITQEQFNLAVSNDDVIVKFRINSGDTPTFYAHKTSLMDVDNPEMIIFTADVGEGKCIVTFADKGGSYVGAIQMDEGSGDDTTLYRHHITINATYSGSEHGVDFEFDIINSSSTQMSYFADLINLVEPHNGVPYTANGAHHYYENAYCDLITSVEIDNDLNTFTGLKVTYISYSQTQSVASITKSTESLTYEDPDLSITVNDFVEELK